MSRAFCALSKNSRGEEICDAIWLPVVSCWPFSPYSRRPKLRPIQSIILHMKRGTTPLPGNCRLHQPYCRPTSCPVLLLSSQTFPILKTRFHKTQPVLSSLRTLDGADSFCLIHFKEYSLMDPRSILVPRTLLLSWRALSPCPIILVAVTGVVSRQHLRSSPSPSPPA